MKNVESESGLNAAYSSRRCLACPHGKASVSFRAWITSILAAHKMNVETKEGALALGIHAQTGSVVVAFEGRQQQATESGTKK